MERRSWRPISFAAKHQVSPSFIYGEIRDKRLRARKAANGVTIITDEDEADWLNAMPTIGAPKNAAEPVSGCEELIEQLGSPDRSPRGDRPSDCRLSDSTPTALQGRQTRRSP
jgi:hypothetical protein